MESYPIFAICTCFLLYNSHPAVSWHPIQVGIGLSPRGRKRSSLWVSKSHILAMLCWCQLAPTIRSGPPHPYLRCEGPELFSLLSLSHLPVAIPKHLDEYVCASPLLLAEGVRYEACCPSLMCVWHRESSHLPAARAHLKNNRQFPGKKKI